jgi:hypothetical protein
MLTDKNLQRFFLLVACAALFIVASGLALPPIVASHFAAGGVANGHMARAVYIAFMLCFVIVLPVAMVLLTWRSLERPGARINLPHRDYWLAPERRSQTIARIRAGMLHFAALLLVFLCYAHALVVSANRAQPAHLDEGWFVAGLLVFLGAGLFWTLRFVRGFRRRG